jgi:LPXTG-motif cell wall-anchored protein
VVRCTPADCEGNGGGTGVDDDFSGIFALPPDTTFEVTFERPGTYTYHCSLHGYALMHGTITVAAAGPATTVTTPPTVSPTAAPTTVVDAGDGLANTGGAPVPLIGVAGAFLVVGLAATGLAARRRTEHDR